MGQVDKHSNCTPRLSGRGDRQTVPAIHAAETCRQKPMLAVGWMSFCQIATDLAAGPTVQLAGR